MAVDQSDMDGTVEVTIPVETVTYRVNGQERSGFIFKNTLRVAFQSGEVVTVPAPAVFTSLADFHVSGLNGADGVAAVNFTQPTGQIIWKFEVTPRSVENFDSPASIMDVSIP